MEAQKFVAQATQDSEIRPFLRRVAEHAAEEAKIEVPESMGITGLDALVFVAALALHRWMKDYFDHRRALKEAEVLERQAKVIHDLIEEGIRPDLAQAVVPALLKGIAKRNADDPLLKAAAALLGKGN